MSFNHVALVCDSSPTLGRRTRSTLTFPNKMQPTNPNAHTYVNGTDGGLESEKYDV